MIRVYKGMYQMTQSEATAVVAFATAVVVAYFFWGAHVLQSQASASTDASVARAE